MTRIRAFLARAWMAIRQSRIEIEVDDEIRRHLEMATEDYVRKGLDPEHARHLALRSFGGLDQTKERCRDVYRFQELENVLQDVRYALRTLRKSPSFTAVAVTILALGIGSNAAVFTVINAALFDGYPLVHRNDRIVQITTNKNAVYYPDLAEWRARAKSFEAVSGVRAVYHTFSDANGAPETYLTTEVSANLFALLGVKPILGRDFLPSDEVPGAEPAVMLRYDVWMNRFGANPAVVGQIVRVDGQPTRVIGIMPHGFAFPWTQDLWMPLIPNPPALRRETFYIPYAYARLAEGATIRSSRAEMETIGGQLASAYPGTNRGVAPVVKGFDEWFIGDNERTFYRSIWGAVVFVLLIVCANVANLLVGRAMGRSHEISIRLALGAGRWRIVRQFLVESLTLSILGGVGGWWIAKAAVYAHGLVQAGNNEVYSVVLTLSMDHRVFAYLMAISISSGVLAGLATAMYLTKLNINTTSRGGKHGKRPSELFVSVEMVLAVVLLATAATISRSFLKVYTADVGVDTRNVLTMDLFTPPARFPNPEARKGFYREIGARLQAIPGVQSVAFGAVPGNPLPRMPYQIDGAPMADEHSRPTAGAATVSTGYFRTLGAKMMAGRDFNDFDRASGLPVVIVNQQFANRNWPGEIAVGKRLRLWLSNSAPWVTIVGVVSNIVQNDRTRQTFEPLVYLPDEQHAVATFALVRTGVAPASLEAAVRRGIYAVDPNLPVAVLWPLAERLDREYGFERNVTTLFVLFAGIALLLASIGLYAAISHSVSRRSHEIGVRIAIGAESRDIMALVFRQGIVPVGVGLMIGLAGAVALNRVLKSQLVGVSPADPVSLLVASSVLVLSAAFGSWMPARRASRVDPAVALRHE